MCLRIRLCSLVPCSLAGIFYRCRLVVEAFVYMRVHVHGLHIYAACVHACACRWGSCPPSQLPAETNQAESFQAAGLDGIDALAELLTLTICSFEVSLTSHKPHCFPEMPYILYYSSRQKLKRSYSPPKHFAGCCFVQTVSAIHTEALTPIWCKKTLSRKLNPNIYCAFAYYGDLV